MGVFSKLFNKKNDVGLASPVTGRTIELKDVNDPTFQEEMLGKGVAIIPSSGEIVSPCNGTIDLMFDTGHAVNIISEDGLEILIHVGLDTVALKGDGFTCFKKTGDEVKKGDKLIQVDIEGVKAKGYDVVTPMVICNTDDYKAVNPHINLQAKSGSTIVLTVEKNA